MSNLKTKPLTSLKTDGDIVSGYILRSKPGGIVRPGPKDKWEPWESEWLLLVSGYGASTYLDLTHLDQFKKLGPEESCRDMEPGTVKYYMARLPAKVGARSPGQTPIVSYWLDVAQSYLMLDDAIEAFEHA